MRESNQLRIGSNCFLSNFYAIRDRVWNKIAKIESVVGAAIEEWNKKHIILHCHV